MGSRHRLRFVYAQTAWMLGAILGLVAFDALSYDFFYVFAFAGFLVVSELTVPSNVTPPWRGRLKWITILGFVGFAVVAAVNIYQYLKPFIS